MIDSENSLKEGFLWFPPHGVLGQLKKSWQKKYCRLFKRSKNGVDRLEVFDSIDGVGKPSAIHTLENCIKISQDAQKHQPHVFAVVTKNNHNYYSANSEKEMNEWISIFQAVAFKDNISRQTIEEDNDLYCSSGDAGVFNVRLVPTDVSTRCGLSAGPYTLLAKPTALQLLDSEGRTSLFAWPYQFIRRYGYRSGRFEFEAGRKCESGEGIFKFEHSRKLFQFIATRMKEMRRLLNTPGSRSPLPPDSDTSGSLLPYLGGPDGSFKMPYVNETTSLKPKVNLGDSHSIKVPEKPIHSKVSTSSEVGSNFLPSEDNTDDSETPAYDDVEVRKEAWRTMGFGDTDKPNVCNTVAVPQSSLQTSRKSEKNESLKVIIVRNRGSSDYHRLDHFGPPARINNHAYQQVNVNSNNSSNNIQFEEPKYPCRRANDSQGYGTIRKKSPVDTSSEDVSKQFFNEGINFALICKAERV